MNLKLSLCLVSLAVLAGCGQQAVDQEDVRPGLYCYHEGQVPLGVGASEVEQVRPESTPRSQEEKTSKEIVAAILANRGVLEGISVVQYDKKNACAELSTNGRRRIYVNEEWIDEYTFNDYWFKYFILAHEIGHLDNYHPVLREDDAWKREYAADFFAGRQLAIGNAARADIKVIEFALSNCVEDSLGSHPPCDFRLQAMLKGFSGGYAQLPPSSRSLAAPVTLDHESDGDGFVATSRSLAVELPPTDEELVRNANLSVSATGLAFIAQNEGFFEYPYNDADGFCTIGHGHVISLKRCEETNTTSFEQGISQQQAIELLRQDAEAAATVVRNTVIVGLSQNQFDALVSFVFNVGGDNFRSSTLLTELNNENMEAVATEFSRWTLANGVAIRGLQNRRRQETELFFGGSIPIESRIQIAALIEASSSSAELIPEASDTTTSAPSSVSEEYTEEFKEQLREKAESAGTSKWMNFAIDELGMTESDRRTDKYTELFGFPGTDQTPWNGAFMGWVLRQANPDFDLRDNPLSSRNYAEIGTSAVVPRVGDIAVFWRGDPDGWTGHVGFVVDIDINEGSVYTLGGNQRNAVSIMKVSVDRVITFRRFEID